MNKNTVNYMHGDLQQKHTVSQNSKLPQTTNVSGQME